MRYLPTHGWIGTVEMALAGAGVTYAALPARANDAATWLRIETKAAAVRIAIVDHQHRRNRARGDAEPRLDAEALTALLERAPG